jgi:hypothetical protein
VRDFPVQVVAPDDPAAVVQEHSPILYGRDLPEIAGRYENNRTDVPLLTYHTIQENEGGETIIEYSVIWSNEDGGTNTPALMARWGRSTDIEWIYRIVLGPEGETRSEVYQGPDHATLPFTGAKEDGHPLLQTATSNNVLNQVVDPSVTSGYRFFLDPSQTQPADRAREVLMDANPWSYQVMAKELIREGKIEQPGSRLRRCPIPAELPLDGDREDDYPSDTAGTRHLRGNGLRGQAARGWHLVHVAQRDPRLARQRDAHAAAARGGRLAGGLAEKAAKAPSAAPCP